jgi:hypothetical protein
VNKVFHIAAAEIIRRFKRKNLLKVRTSFPENQNMVTELIKNLLSCIKPDPGIFPKNAKLHHAAKQK